MSNQRYLVSVNSELLCLTDCTKQIHLFSDCLTGKYLENELKKKLD
jgi:hypothetical protein